MLRLLLLSVTAGIALGGCAAEQEPCEPPGWDEEEVRRAFTSEDTGPDVEVRALTWGRLSGDPDTPAPPEAERAAVVVWVGTEARQHLATYAMPGDEPGAGRVWASRSFSGPVRRLDVTRYVRDHYSTVETREGRSGIWQIEVPAGRQLSLTERVCPEAFADVIFAGDKLGPPRGLRGYIDRVVWARTYDPVEFGQHLYEAQACNTCHSIDGSRKIGPSMMGIWQAERCIEGQSEPVVADSAYVRQSIAAHTAHTVCGYPGVGPDYPQLGAEQLDALVAYIADLNGDSSRPPGPFRGP